jgi:hypothetical protein
MRKVSIVLLLGLLISLVVIARISSSSQEQVEMEKHLRAAKHAGAQPAVNSQKVVDESSAQSKLL